MIAIAAVAVSIAACASYRAPAAAEAEGSTAPAAVADSAARADLPFYIKGWELASYFPLASYPLASFPASEAKIEGWGKIKEKGDFDVERAPELLAAGVIHSDQLFYRLRGTTYFFHKGALQSIGVRLTPMSSGDAAEVQRYRNKELAAAAPLPPWFIERGLGMDQPPSRWIGVLATEGFRVKWKEYPRIEARDSRNDKLGLWARYYDLVGTFYAWHPDAPNVRITVEIRACSSTPGDAPGIIAEVKFGGDNGEPIEHAPDPRPASPLPFEYGNEKAFGLALSAILCQANGTDCFGLAEKEKNEKNAEWAKRLLKDSWSVEGHEAAVDCVARLDLDMHASSWRELAALLDASPGASALEIAERESLSPSKMAQLVYVARTRDLVGDKGIDAWDHGRRVSVARWSYLAGYLSEEEAWAAILDTADKVQGRYVGWEEFAAHYVVGRGFWAVQFSDEVEKMNEGIDLAYRAFAAPGSEWRRAWLRKGWMPKGTLTLAEVRFVPEPEDKPLLMLNMADNVEKGLETVALGRLDSLGDSYPDSFIFHYHRARLYARCGAKAKGLALLDDLGRRFPTEWRSFALRASLAEGDGDKDAWEAASARALALAPENADLLFSAARLAYARADYRRAADLMAKAEAGVAPCGSSESAWFFLFFGMALNEAGDGAAATPRLVPLLNAYPRDSRLRFNVGLSYYLRGSAYRTEAVSHFRVAEALGYRLPDVIARWVAEGDAGRVEPDGPASVLETAGSV